MKTETPRDRKKTLKSYSSFLPLDRSQSTSYSDRWGQSVRKCMSAVTGVKSGSHMRRNRSSNRNRNQRQNPVWIENRDRTLCDKRRRKRRNLIVRIRKKGKKLYLSVKFI